MNAQQNPKLRDHLATSCKRKNNLVAVKNRRYKHLLQPLHPMKEEMLQRLLPLPAKTIAVLGHSFIATIEMEAKKETIL